MKIFLAQDLKDFSCPESSSPSPISRSLSAPILHSIVSTSWANAQKFEYAVDPIPKTEYLETQQISLKAECNVFNAGCNE